ncbi:MAG TPA: bifunctional diaminohydroxyphosphoribosylaminopyrimidine deaminase/5-amino-6-(5-phosphoribosylamino)uracil reductase RibD [Flavobacterium sp.]|uniref:bifunctional diaminohydroxyphosphoribosylaminopyrimidine deaminase/5-amino-6-(5-phosphoribosylamino)uracil reductase RibD n=1 Tax=Flavobacterium sp. TaxID=239 RepID=UPI001B754A1E|nr:bifunctional diaminohydroxyphosphoribosylaminopyrimidine deaminase/5-amino-6-(5-phosphoribosylamino)uracil reductase RibD [Flavobacterium sp.]MBP7317382.1 bifunctional diaminohydroxyphosphoribosylaminopyrimidine deaminase/5-amino-6-(5-phosphoribosylamino)uracil reductase RibD [Flavobacterium sp.]MBP8885903.1 bifunctional diaminohydroxyphosphoribosylaminopyrimidine deaminase/5-amino-6-(5-phosphoribosylamino)uracil reductase RibD [Flavobacterium sp.]HRL70578.1 bifunctional diaminohydroxyphospho
MKINEKYIRRCIELARNGLGTTYPNPLVGSVIVYDGKIIGEGWHKKSGESHAEVNAVKAVKDKSLLKKATIYVSLEPCSHFGKTPPCCDLIIKNNIPNVVIGTVDPNVKVAGNGIKKLIEAGIHVTVGVLEEECNALNKRFFTFHKKKRPFIVLKWAESQDGFIAPTEKLEKKPVWITNQYSRQLVHKWRTEEQAILVGTQTAIDDNPKLNARDWSGKNPIRLVIDQNNRIEKNNHIFDNQAVTIVFSKSIDTIKKENTIFEILDFEKNIAEQIVQILYQHQIQSVIIEGGRQTLQTFIDANLWDEARVFVGSIKFKEGTQAPTLAKNQFKKQSIGTDELTQTKNYD